VEDDDAKSETSSFDNNRFPTQTSAVDPPESQGMDSEAYEERIYEEEINR